MARDLPFCKCLHPNDLNEVLADILRAPLPSLPGGLFATFS